MADVGTRFFTTDEEELITILNIDGVTLNVESYKLLVGLTLPAKRGAMFWYESFLGITDRSTAMIPDTEGYCFTAEAVIEAIENADRDATLWKKLEKGTVGELPIINCKQNNL